MYCVVKIDIPEKKKPIVLETEPEQSHFVPANEEMSPLSETEDNKNSRNVPVSASAPYYGTDVFSENNIFSPVSVSESLNLNQKLPIQARDTFMQEKQAIVLLNFSVPTGRCGFQDVMVNSPKPYTLGFYEYTTSASSHLSVLSQ